MFTRTEQLIGDPAFARLRQVRVLLVGVGGVGGWCAEALVRTGIQHLTIVDYDTIDVTNINRQIVALSTNTGKPKVEEMKKRLLAVNPDADIVAINGRYGGDNGLEICFDDYDYVLDAIDSVAAKTQLLNEASRSRATLFSAMGAGHKTDALSARVAEFGKVGGCPLARAVRHRMKHIGQWPAKKFLCVFAEHQTDRTGTIAPVVGTFGMALAGLVVSDIIAPNTGK